MKDERHPSSAALLRLAAFANVAHSITSKTTAAEIALWIEQSLLGDLVAARKAVEAPRPMLLWCPAPGCGARHIDKAEFETQAHHTHACQACGMVWRPAIGLTVGVQFLPGFKDA